MPPRDELTLPTRIHNYASINFIMSRQDGYGLHITLPAGHHQELHRRPNGIALVFHDNDILTWTPQNTVYIDAHGWYTQSTRERMNDWLPSGLQVALDRGYWGVITGPGWLAYHPGMEMDLINGRQWSTPYDHSMDREHNAQVEVLIKKWNLAIKRRKTFDNDDTPFRGAINNPADRTAYALRVLQETRLPKSLMMLVRRGPMTSPVPDAKLLDAARGFFRSTLYVGHHIKRGHVLPEYSTEPF